MNLYNFCFNIYNTDNRPFYNGIEPSQNTVIVMVGIVYNTLTKGIQGDKSNLPSVEKLLDIEVSPNDEFDSQNLADIVRLVFDFVTEQNRNPELWSRNEDIQAEISHTLTVFIHGALGEILPSSQGAVRGEKYSEVKACLQKDIKSSYNPFN